MPCNCRHFLDAVSRCHVVSGINKFTMMPTATTMGEDAARRSRSRSSRADDIAIKNESTKPSRTRPSSAGDFVEAKPSSSKRHKSMASRTQPSRTRPSSAPDTRQIVEHKPSVTVVIADDAEDGNNEVNEHLRRAADVQKQKRDRRTTTLAIPKQPGSKRQRTYEDGKTRRRRREQEVVNVKPPFKGSVAKADEVD